MTDDEQGMKIIQLIHDYQRAGLSDVETCEILLGGAVAAWTHVAGNKMTAQYLRLFADEVEAKDEKPN